MMNSRNSRQTWKHPWSYREGTIITVAIVLLGFCIQFAGGGTVFRLAGFPWNLVSGIVFIAFLVILFYFLKKHPAMRWLGSVKAALPAILGFTFLVLLMGFVKQDVPSKNNLVQILGLNNLVKTWPFMMVNLYLLLLLGIVTLKRLTPLNLKNAGFFLNHFGLFLVFLSTALGSGDVRTLNMECYENQENNTATNENGQQTELPISIKLLNFNIDEFRPKVAILSNLSGEIHTMKGNQTIEMLDRKSFDLFQYHVEVDTFFAASGKVGDSYYSVNEPGSSPSAKLRVTSRECKSNLSGWICSGSYAMQPEALKLDESYSLIMLPAEPKKFSSEVLIKTKDGNRLNALIEVNQPFRIDGWTIYQFGYNKAMGRWSDKSVLQLVRDPWLPVVYTGIFLMMAGAVFLFLFGKPKDGGIDHVA